MVGASSGLALNFEALRLDIGGCGPGSWGVWISESLRIAKGIMGGD